MGDGRHRQERGERAWRWIPPTQDRVEAYFKELNNWGRWGDADQVGTVNLITTAKRGQAQTLVRTGRRVSLARDIGPQRAGATWCPIDPLFDGITTRGVFLDVAAARKDGFARRTSRPSPGT